MEMLKSSANATVVDILRTLNVPVKFIEPDGKFLLENQYGSTAKIPHVNKYWVHIRNGLSIAQQQKTLCHELGHIVLGHMTDEVFPFISVSQREKEADEFASFILPYIYNRSIQPISIPFNPQQ